MLPPSGCQATLTPTLELGSGSLLQKPFLTCIVTPGILFSVSLGTLGLSVLICEMG